MENQVYECKLCHEILVSDAQHHYAFMVCEACTTEHEQGIDQ
ncbi:hypothetical protein [Photobacterium aquae]|nr:hypothetical protein [Photobacterium aquae]